MSENTYAPGIYVKGAVERVAHSTRDAVALAFDGFKPKSETVAVVAEEEVALEQPVSDEPSVDEQPTKDEIETTPPPAPSPRELARKKSQEDDKS